MKCKKKVMVILVSMLLMPLALAEQPDVGSEGTESSMTTQTSNTSRCTFGGSTRTIEIRYDASPRRVPCRVLYTRNGNTQQLWQAQNVEGYCEEKAAGLAETLEAAGWNCE